MGIKYDFLFGTGFIFHLRRNMFNNYLVGLAFGILANEIPVTAWGKGVGWGEVWRCWGWQEADIERENRVQLY